MASGSETLTKKGQKAVQDGDVKNITLEHAGEQGIPAQGQAQTPLTNEEIEQQKKTTEGESAEASDSTDDTAVEEPAKSKLTIQVYKGDPTKKAEDDKQEDAETTDEQQTEANQAPVAPQAAVVPQAAVAPAAAVVQRKAAPAAAAPAAAAPAAAAPAAAAAAPAAAAAAPAAAAAAPAAAAAAPAPAGELSMAERRLIGAKVSGDIAARGALQANADDNVGMKTTDKVKTSIDMASSTIGLAGTLTGIGGSDGYGGDSVHAERADKAAGGLSLASDTLSLASTGISIFQNAQNIKENDEFTTTGTKARQGLGMISDVSSGLGTMANMGSTIAGFHDGDKAEKASAGLGIASNSLGALSNSIGLGVGIADLVGNSSDSKALKAQMASPGASEEFKRYAQIAQDSKSLQNTQSGFNIAKSAAGLFGNATGLAGSIGKTLGVEDSSTSGKLLKGFGLAGSLVSSLVGTAATFLGPLVGKFQKNKRSEKGIDQYLNTGELKQKILEKGHNLSIDETRKVAMTQLGYKTSDQMFSAILLQYATTIREKALSGDATEQTQYKTLIQSLGFKLGTAGTTADLPPVKAISEKLAGG